jgi:hypothetical protein
MQSGWTSESHELDIIMAMDFEDVARRHLPRVLIDGSVAPQVNDQSTEQSLARRC